MVPVPYDHHFEPPAPVLPLRVNLPASGGSLQLAGLVDTGADITLLPEDIAERHLPVAGTIAIRGVTGEVVQATLYRAELEVGDHRRALIVAGLGRETIAGRDLLSGLVVTLDGPAQQLSFAAGTP
jgi:predicted aspartyl protease